MEFTVQQIVLFTMASLVPGAIVSCIVTGLIRRHAVGLGLLDQPGERKVHQVPTPLGGGIGIWSGFVFVFIVGTLLVWLRDATWVQAILPDFARPHLDGVLSKLDSLWILIGAGTALAIVGLADDKWGIGWKPRLGAQFLIALICVAWQGWRATAFISIPLVPGLISVIWIVAMINSFNMLDNMDGITTITSIFSALFVVLAAALEAGVISPNTQYECSGAFEFANRKFHCWNERGHGFINAEQSLERSCDIYYYQRSWLKIRL